MLLAVEHIVLALGTNGLVQVQSLTNSQRIVYVFRIPVTGGPVEGLAFFDDLVKASAYLFNRSLVIMKVCVKDVHIIQL